jgi:CRISPR-associated endonuclease/helicase Cas3
MLDSSLLRARLATLAGVGEFPPCWAPRLAVLAYLHDFGKANRKFQRGLGGHLKEAAYLAASQARRQQAGLEALDQFGVPAEFLLAVLLGHHGEPPDFSTLSLFGGIWSAGEDRDPLADVRELIGHARAIWPEAFAPGGPPLPSPDSRFWHAFLGLLQLADWLGSDDASDAFPYSEEGDGPRIDFARGRVRELLDRIGFDGRSLRAHHAAPFDFERLFSFAPTDIQRAAAEAPGPVVVLEAETGSGKTEAALWRFATVFATGKVDGLYFALPTRVAATQLHGRVQACVDRMFPGAGIEVVRALPGDVSSGSAAVRALPDFQVQWSDDPDEATRRARWAAERPKRFLAAPIAVGTIDQALLGAVKARHAQMRSACLARSLLVVDEVHASDVYMERLLVNLLDQHRAAGGEALLLSATLGAAARTRLLLGAGRAAQRATPLPDDAKGVAYPAISWVEAGRVVSHKKDGRGRGKRLTVEPSHAIAEPDAVAAMALDAAGRGAKVLVVRNTVRDAVATARALQGLAPEHPALFRLDGIATLHHGRFARSDRVRLDGAVEAAIGKTRRDGPLIVVGTQTLEQSLDIDADHLITDLAPIDVLLQRIGRLHRHERARPTGFETPRALVLMPQSFDATLTAIERDRSGPHGFGSVYDNLIALAAAARLIGAGTTWDIPAMNRALVEAGTHPHALDATTERLIEETGDARWGAAAIGKLGKDVAKRQTAQNLMVEWERPVSDFRAADGVVTRLGLGDRELEFPGGLASPFSSSPPIERLVLPAHLLTGIDVDAQPVDIAAVAGGFSFRLSARVFSYSQHGLERQ